MARTISDFIKEEHRSFDEFPFTPIDALIFAEATYFQWEYILSNIWTAEWPYGASDSLFLGDMPDTRDLPVFGQYTADTPQNTKMIDAIRTNPRYSNVSISHFCARTDEKEEIQFAAMCFHLTDSLCYIAFRGTDGTWIGWKEDFQLSYRYPVSAQKEASRYISYLERELAPELEFYVGGHSKGGNLAIYGATGSTDAFKSRIRKIYSFDGPGFSFRLHDTDEYKKIAQKVEHLVPQSSFVGMLLTSAPGTKYISNRNLWLVQHSPFTWDIDSEDFVYVAKLDSNAQARIAAIHSWLDDLSYEDRESFTEMLYKIGTASGATNLFQPKVSWAKKMSYFIEATKATDSKSRARIMETLKLLFLMTRQQRRL
ncbi:MAG: DUF2974 domain-containing protein [Clostridiales bacterium]|nr:DUF2974 domain-containing protein [Clostridiales bacterium]